LRRNLVSRNIVKMETKTEIKKVNNLEEWNALEIGDKFLGINIFKKETEMTFSGNENNFSRYLESYTNVANDPTIREYMVEKEKIEFDKGIINPLEIKETKHYLKSLDRGYERKLKIIKGGQN